MTPIATPQAATAPEAVAVPARSFAALRISLGLLMLVWGLDKLVNPAHGQQVSAHFYGGVLTQAAAIRAFGVAQLVLAAALVAGRGTRVAYPALLVVTGTTLLGVWRSVVDPWAWWLAGGNALFFPSLIIFAAAVVLQTGRRR